MERKFYKQCWFWLMMIFILLLVSLIFDCSCWHCLKRILLCVDFWTIASSIAAIIALLWSVHIFRDEKKRERQRATMEALPALREKYFEVQSKIFNMSKDDKNEYLKSYASELERFAVGVNGQIYDIDLINRMCGSMLTKQYRTVMKKFIEKRREENSPDYTSPDKIYCEYEKMIENLEKTRKDK